MALETSNLRAIRNLTAVGWDTSPALWGCSLLRTSSRNSFIAWTNRNYEIESKQFSIDVIICKERKTFKCDFKKNHKETAELIKSAWFKLGLKLSTMSYRWKQVASLKVQWMSVLWCQKTRFSLFSPRWAGSTVSNKYVTRTRTNKVGVMRLTHSFLLYLKQIVSPRK